jgi:ABC-type iron transport system FetAB permease component
MSTALKGTIPFGGQILPNSTVGAKLAAKNAQKKPKKNKLLTKINQIIKLGIQKHTREKT